MNETLVTSLKAIADDSRLKILKLLLTNSYCVKALSKRLKISEAAVSQHLQVLRKADLVTGIKKGYYTHYEVTEKTINEIGNNIINLIKKKE
jgi:ArsR family transcriptional regulator